MIASDVIAALDLPLSARVDQRVPKKLIIENGNPTSADKRYVSEGIEELTWIAAIKPNNVGATAYRDEVREYLEIAVLSLILRPAAKAARLTELVHRAIPYPVLLLHRQPQEDNKPETLNLSVAHKRHAQNEADRVVLDGAVIAADLPADGMASEYLAAFRLSGKPAANLLTLYQGWLEGIEAISAASITGRCTLRTDEIGAAIRRKALAEHERLTREIAQLRAQAGRESQLARRVELNLEIKRLEAALAEAQRQL